MSKIVNHVRGKMDKPTNEGTLDQILRNDGNGGSIWGNAATQEEIGAAVDQWMDENIPAGQAVAIDKTLTVENAAAGAKAAGDMVMVSENEPSAASNKLWIHDQAESEYTVPTIDDFNEFSDDMSELVEVSDDEPTSEFNKVWIDTDSGNEVTVPTIAEMNKVAGTVAPDYSELTFPVAKGTLCRHEYDLYEAKVEIPSVEAWTSGHWSIKTNIANKLDSLSRVLNDATAVTILKTVSVGTLSGCGIGVALSSMSIIDSTTRLRSTDTKNRTDLIRVLSGNTIEISCKAGYAFAYQGYPVSNGYGIYNYSFQTEHAIIKVEQDTDFVFVFKKINDSPIDVSEIDNFCVAYGARADVLELRSKVETAQDDIEEIETNVDSIENDIYKVNAISVSDFDYGYIEANGTFRQGTYGTETLSNIATPLMIAKQGVVISPLTSETIFKVALFDSDKELISVTGWMGKTATGYATIAVDSYTIEAPYCRIAMANNYTGNKNVTVSAQLERYAITPTKTIKIGDSLPVVFPFVFDVGVSVYKNQEKYITDFAPQHKALTDDSGVVVFISTDGNNENDGLTVLTPKKTLFAALSVENVLTIIMMPGNYISGTHFSEGMQITQPINLIGIGEVIIDNVDARLPLRFYRNLYCENIHFKHGNNTIEVSYSDASRYATFYKCTFSESNTLNGLAVKGGTCYIVNCLAYGNAFDGFNYHKSDNNVINTCIEIDCTSYGNGTYNLSGAEGQSSNASTSHDGNYIVRVNGEYYACHGGIIADKECHTANYGCRAGISTITDVTNYPDRMSNYWCSYGHMWLFDCISYGSKYDTAVVNGGSITSNVEYSSNYPS